jgi:hypothetical protein
LSHVESGEAGQVLTAAGTETSLGLLQCGCESCGLSSATLVGSVWGEDAIVAFGISVYLRPRTCTARLTVIVLADTSTRMIAAVRTSSSVSQLRHGIPSPIQ